MKKKLNILGHKIVPGLDGEVFDFSNSSNVDPFAVVNIKPWINSTPENGWNVRNGSLGIGDGIQYKRNVKSDLSLMLDLKNRNSTSLSITVDVKVEKGFDYVEIYATSGDDKIDLDKLTGILPLKTYTYGLNEFSGKNNVCLHFLFFSDGYGTERGVEIYEIGIF